MVKKIRLDFSKVEESSGWNSKAMPEGLHAMKIVGVEQTEAQDGTDMLIYALVPTDPRYKSRRFPFYCKLQQNQMWKLRDLLVAAGVSVPKKAAQVDIEAPIGKTIAAEVTDASGQYQGRSEINGTYGLEILEEDGTEPDDEDEEEYEDEEVEEEEDDEDLSLLALPALRKMAKDLGIDTAGLKKDDLIEAIEEEQADDEDDDDLDDEDLEDEDLDDEEDFEDDEEEDEEPEPAPRRRPAAKAAPARKAPARKAAPAKKATPARRVVRR